MCERERGLDTAEDVFKRIFRQHHLHPPVLVHTQHRDKALVGQEGNRGGVRDATAFYQIVNQT